MTVVLGSGEQTSGSDWATLIVAAAAAVSALMATVAVLLEGRRMRLNLGLDNMWRLIEKWDELRLHTCRAAAAHSMLADPDARADLPQEALDVLNIFELLAYLVVRSKTLKMEDVWVNFPAAIQWWYVCRPGIEALRKDDPTIYEDYVALVDDMISLEVKRRGRSREALTPSESDMTAFLEGEASLAAPQPSGWKSSWPWGRREE